MNAHNPRLSAEAPLSLPGLRAIQSVRTRIVSSETLFRGEHEIGVEHHGTLYRLRITRQGKLILTK